MRWTYRKLLTPVLFLIALSLLGSPALALEPTDKWEGMIDYAATGGSFLEDTCQASVFGCLGGEVDGQGDSVTNTSTSTLYGIPDKAQVVKAYLVWMGSIKDGEDQPDGEVFFRPPRGDSYPVSAAIEDLEEIRFEGKDVNDETVWFHYYTYRVDITEIVRRHYVVGGKPLNGDYTVSGFYATADEPYKLRTVAVGGWSFFVVYSIPPEEKPKPKRIYFYTDFRAIRDESVILKPEGFLVPLDPTAKITFFLGEGDENIKGMGQTATHEEALYFNKTTLSDRCNPDDNAYNGTVTTNITPEEEASPDGCRKNQYSIDLDTFYVSHLLQAGQTSAEVELSLGQDQVFTNYLILSIDTKLPDFDIPDEPEKISDPEAGGVLYPGQEFVYKIFVQNNGEDLATNVVVRDRLPNEVIYTPNSTFVTEPDGTKRAIEDLPGSIAPSLQGIKIADIMPTGRLYRRTVEIGVRLKTLEEGITKESIIENLGEIISGSGDIYFTNGGSFVRHTVQLESYEGTLYFERGDKHPGAQFIMQGEKGVVAAHLKLKALNGDVRLTSFKFSMASVTGVTYSSGMIENASLYLDANGDGAVDAGDTQLGKAMSWSGGVIPFNNFTAFPVVAKNQIAHMILTVDISSSAALGSQAKLELKKDGASVRGLIEGLPISAAEFTIPDASTKLSVEPGINTPPDGYLTPNVTAPVLQMRLRAYADGVSVTGMTVGASGSLFDPSGVTGITAILDANGNGKLDGGETQIGNGTFGVDDGYLTFRDLSIPVSKGGEVNVLFLGSFAADLEMNSNFRLVVTALEAGDAGIMGLPLAGAQFTFINTVEPCSGAGGDAHCLQVLGENWVCDEVREICIVTSVHVDGDTEPSDGDVEPSDGDEVPVDGDGIEEEPPIKEDKDGGCRSFGLGGESLALLLASFAALALLRRRQGA